MELQLRLKRKNPNQKSGCGELQLLTPSINQSEVKVKSLKEILQGATAGLIISLVFLVLIEITY